MYILKNKVYPSHIGRRTKRLKGQIMKMMNDVNGQIQKGYITQTNIRKWGNSQGIRLSKEAMSQMHLKENDTVEINICDGKMTIEKSNKPKYLNLTERLEAFYKKPIEEIYVEGILEVEVGGPVGNEVW